MVEGGRGNILFLGKLVLSALAWGGGWGGVRKRYVRREKVACTQFEHFRFKKSRCHPAALNLPLSRSVCCGPAGEKGKHIRPRKACKCDHRVCFRWAV